MAGPARALDTIGGQVTWQSTAFGAICVGLMSMFIVGRHTRAEEESGRDELVRAAAIGRLAPMTAALQGRAARQRWSSGSSWRSAWRRTRSRLADSIALGVGLTLCGWVFTGTALVAAQLTASTRSMYGIAGAVIGVAYACARSATSAARPELAVADRLVPGDARLLRPALVAGAAPARRRRASHRWRRTPCSSAATSAPASSPRARARTAPAPASAARSAWPGTCSAASVIGWTAGLFLMGLAYGSIGDDVGDLVGDSETSQDLFLQGVGRPRRRLLRDLAADAGADRVRLRHLLGAAPARRGGGRPGRVAAGDRPATARLAARPRRRDRPRGRSPCWPRPASASGLGYALVTGDAGAVGQLLLPLLSYVAPVLVLAAVARLLVRREPAAGHAGLAAAACWRSW